MTDVVTVVLISTCAPDRPGSMKRYAQLVGQSLKGSENLRFKTVNLAPAVQQLSKWPLILRSTIHHRMIRRQAAALQENVLYHLLDGSHGYVLDHLPAGAKKVVTCHDFIPLLHMDGALPGRPSPFSRRIIQRSVRALGQTNAVLCDSALTKNIFTQQHPDFSGLANVIHLPLNDRLLATAHERTSDKDPYLFHIGHNAAYKNRMGVLRIFEQIAAQWPGKLVIAGDPPTQEMQQFVETKDLGARVAFRVHPNDDELWGLYRGASLFLFPSLVEGYGWPPLEASACGCPVVASKAGALPDILGEGAAILHAPGDIAGYATSCMQLLYDPVRCSELVQAAQRKLSTLTLEDFGQQVADVYRELAS